MQRINQAIPGLFEELGELAFRARSMPEPSEAGVAHELELRFGPPGQFTDFNGFSRAYKSILRNGAEDVKVVYTVDQSVVGQNGVRITAYTDRPRTMITKEPQTLTTAHGRQPLVARVLKRYGVRVGYSTETRRDDKDTADASLWNIQERRFKARRTFGFPTFEVMLTTVDTETVATGKRVRQYEVELEFRVGGPLGLLAEHRYNHIMLSEVVMDLIIAVQGAVTTIYSTDQFGTLGTVDALLALNTRPQARDLTYPDLVWGKDVAASNEPVAIKLKHDGARAQLLYLKALPYIWLYNWSTTSYTLFETYPRPFTYIVDAEVMKSDENNTHIVPFDLAYISSDLHTNVLQISELANRNLRERLWGTSVFGGQLVSLEAILNTLVVPGMSVDSKDYWNIIKATECDPMIAGPAWINSFTKVLIELEKQQNVEQHLYDGLVLTLAGQPYTCTPKLPRYINTFKIKKPRWCTVDLAVFPTDDNIWHAYAAGPGQIVPGPGSAAPIMRLASTVTIPPHFVIIKEASGNVPLNLEPGAVWEFGYEFTSDGKLTLLPRNARPEKHLKPNGVAQVKDVRGQFLVPITAATLADNLFAVQVNRILAALSNSLPPTVQVWQKGFAESPLTAPITEVADPLPEEEGTLPTNVHHAVVLCTNPFKGNAAKELARLPETVEYAVLLAPEDGNVGSWKELASVPVMDNAGHEAGHLLVCQSQMALLLRRHDVPAAAGAM
jgi:hypothetical protein